MSGERPIKVRSIPGNEDDLLITNKLGFPIQVAIIRRNQNKFRFMVMEQTYYPVNYLDIDKIIVRYGHVVLIIKYPVGNSIEINEFHGTPYCCYK